MEENSESPENMTETQLAERIGSLIGNTPSTEERQNIHTFLHNVAVAKDTTKTGFLSEEELGTPNLPVRTYKELALFCNDVANMGYFADYLSKKAEILTSTSLSKNAKLLGLAILQKREVADVTNQPKKPNKGWFSKKGPANVEGVE